MARASLLPPWARCRSALLPPWARCRLSVLLMGRSRGRLRWDPPRSTPPSRCRRASGREVPGLADDTFDAPYGYRPDLRPERREFDLERERRVSE